MAANETTQKASELFERIEARRTEYNLVRPHSALGRLAPSQFRPLQQTKSGQSTNLRLVYSEG
ncbi:integrase core domain-containing protein [Pararobbsia silviterrae]|uniref:integrase core domain-containing protein n=1 Tax=Pararobbsia silviterrae TaxID=1792498 RepID=UPI003B8337FD